MAEVAARRSAGEPERRRPQARRPGLTPPGEKAVADAAAAAPAAVAGAGAPGGGARARSDRIEQIKAAVASGSYRLDLERLADRLIERDALKD